MKTKILKTILSVTLCAAMVVGFVPTQTFAAAKTTTKAANLSSSSNLTKKEYEAKYGMNEHGVHCPVCFRIFEDGEPFDASKARTVKMRVSMPNMNGVEKMKSTKNNMFKTAKIGDVVELGGKKYRYLTSKRMVNAQNEYSWYTYDVGLLLDESCCLASVAISINDKKNENGFEAITSVGGKPYIEPTNEKWTVGVTGRIVDDGKYAIFDVPAYGKTYGSDGVIILEAKTGGMEHIFKVRYEDLCEYVKEVELDRINSVVKK